MHAAGFQQKKLELCLLTKTVGLGGVQLYNIQEKRQLEEERGQPSLGPCREALRQVLYQKAVDFGISKKRKRGRRQGKASRVIKHQPDLLLLPPCIISLTFPLLSCCPDFPVASTPVDSCGQPTTGDLRPGERF